jgi:hypothetical protein
MFFATPGDSALAKCSTQPSHNENQELKPEILTELLRKDSTLIEFVLYFNHGE